MEENTIRISLEILLLNDLLRTNVIDKAIYEKAAELINKKNNEKLAA